MHSIWLVLVLSVLSSGVSAGTLGDLTYEITDTGVAITDCNEAAEGELVIPAEIEGLPVTIIRGAVDTLLISNQFGAFTFCSGLTSITIPEGVTSIGIYAFGGCSSLTSINIPGSVTSIEHGAFLGCRSLTSITIGEGVASIGDEAFRNCSSLTSINLPDMFQSAGELWRMRATAALIFGENDLLSYAQGYNQIVITDCETAAKGDLVIPNQIEGYPVTSIGGSIPDSVTFLPSAFYNCSSLTSITIPDSVTSIGDRAFQNCSRLKSITLPDSVTSIGDWAFIGCRRLKSIITPKAFYNESEASRLGLNHLWPNGFFLFPLGSPLNNLNYEISNGQVAITDCKTSAAGELAIPAEIEGYPVTSIGGSAFSGCRRLKSITIPEGVTSIGNSAFEDCRRLKSITIPDSVTSIGHSAFAGCRRLTSITIPNSVTSIGGSAFNGCRRLTSVIIPEGVSSIGNSAFEDCRRLKSITIPEAFHSQSEANRLGIGRLWPDGFSLPSSSQVFLPSSVTRTPELSIRLPNQLVVTGDQNTQAVIEATDSITGPWTQWRTVVIGKEGTTEVDLDEGAEKRFYRVRE